MDDIHLLHSSKVQGGVPTSQQCQDLPPELRAVDLVGILVLERRFGVHLSCREVARPVEEAVEEGVEGLPTEPSLLEQGAGEAALVVGRVVRAAPPE